ncbi:MAG TPA: acetylxylan esterase [Mycobacteriales bacterium]|nr:acetylxylan esterase [Mycobacteriales bacterium]
MFVDLPLTELRDYRPEVACPPDFDEFWAVQMATARGRGAPPTLTPVNTRMRHADVFDVTFTGHGGDPVRAWLLVPARPAPRAATVIEYVGYGGGRGDPFDWLGWSCAGHPHLVMDCRGQGGTWRGADTADPGDGGAPAGGFCTRGIADPGGYYFTRLFVDAARAVDAVRGHPLTAARPLVTTGASQGGALAVAAAYLAGGVAATMPDVPFLAHPRRAVQITDARPYGELVEYCAVYPDRVDRVFATLSYLDVVNHARRAGVPALFSVGLIDEITPASTVFAAYNHYSGPKDITVYPFSGHEGGGTRQFLAKLNFLDRLLADRT